MIKAQDRRRYEHGCGQVMATVAGGLVGYLGAYPVRHKLFLMIMSQPNEELTWSEVIEMGICVVAGVTDQVEVQS
ncbi:MAG TPA: hypothetical protein VGO93_03745 [Candidatus Xenobia bacterium]|jgi:hypothetical protein